MVASGCSHESNASSLSDAGSDAESDTGSAPDAEGDVEAEADKDAGPFPVASRRFGPFAPWANPIEDDKAVGEATHPGQYRSSINELQPFGRSLWIGYGDADYNLGEQTPIESRSFSSA